MLTPPPKPPPIPIPIGGEAMRLTPEEVRLNELGQMAARGEYALGITAATLAAAKCAIYEDQVQFDGEWVTQQRGGETVLHDAALFGNYPPGTTLEILAETIDAENTSALEVTFKASRDQGLPLPPCCTGTALAKLKLGNSNKTWLHLALTYCNPSGTTPELLYITGRNGWTALHAAADNGRVIPGTTLSLLKNTVTPPHGPSVANFSAFDAFFERIEQDLEDGVKLGDRYFTILQTSVINLMRASLSSIPNVAGHEELHRLAKIFNKFAPVETAMWFAAELTELQQRVKPCSDSR